MAKLSISAHMSSGELQKHILATYLSLRIGIAVLGITFPLILAIGGYFYAGLCLQDSMSAYYHASVQAGRSMRDWFVGTLFAVGVFLYLYRGYSHLENYLLNAAGVLAVGVALFPMPWNPCELRSCDAASQAVCTPEKVFFSMHGFCAIAFFCCIALVCFFCAGDTLPLIKDRRLRHRLKHLYRAIGMLMIASMAAAYFINVHNRARTFYVEAFGIFSFGAYWWVKSWELGRTAAEDRALRGHLRNTGGEVHDLSEELLAEPGMPAGK